MIYAIPAIDIINGRVVRLQQGDYGKVTTYEMSPYEWGKSIVDQGFSRLHVIDLEGAKKGENTLLPEIKKLASLAVNIQVGGGIRTVENASSLIEVGADRVIVSTSALENPNFLPSLIDAIGEDRIILSLDVRDGTVATRGWLVDTGLVPVECLRMLPDLKHLIVTDIERDGTLSADVNVDLYRLIVEAFPDIHLIAAGGISSITSMNKLEKAGCHGCIIGKSFYEIKGLKEKLIKEGFV